MIPKPEVVDSKKLFIRALTEITGNFADFPDNNIGLYYYWLALGFVGKRRNIRRNLEENKATIKCSNMENIANNKTIEQVLLFGGYSNESGFEDSVSSDNISSITVNTTGKTTNINKSEVIILKEGNYFSPKATFYIYDVSFKEFVVTHKIS